MQTVDGTGSVVITDDGRTYTVPAVVLGVAGMYAISKPLDFEQGNGESNRVKFIAGIRLDLETDDTGAIPPALTIKVGWQLSMEDPITYTDEIVITALNPLIWLPDGGISGVYITFHIQDYIPVISWKLTKIEFLGRVMGFLKA